MLVRKKEIERKKTETEAERERQREGVRGQINEQTRYCYLIQTYSTRYLICFVFVFMLSLSFNNAKAVN